MNGTTSENQLSSKVSMSVLVAIDVLAVLIFAIVGQMFHSAAGPVDWLINAPRIAVPFLVGWGAAAMVLGAYPRAGQIGLRRFAINSILTLIAGDLIAFGIRAFIFADTVNWTFAFTALAFTTLFVVGPRLLYFWAMTARTLRDAQA